MFIAQIAVSWYREWEAYTNMVDGESMEAKPPEIDNTPLFVDDSEHLKRGLTDRYDFEIVSEEVWKLLHGW